MFGSVWTDIALVIAPPGGMPELASRRSDPG
jgi:hypothetical protein